MSKPKRLWLRHAQPPLSYASLRYQLAQSSTRTGELIIMNRQATVVQHVSRSEALRNIIIFALLVNGLAWLGPLLGGDPTNPGLGFLLWGIAPIASALIMKFVLRDGTPLGFRPYLRGNGRWYLLGLLLYPIAILAVLGIGLLTGVTSVHNLTLPALITAVGPPVIIYFVFAFFEEVGWRGYLAPRVATIHDGLLGHVLVGLIWASWHFPYMTELWAHTSEGLVTLLPRFVLGTMISAVVYGEIRLRTGSLWPAVLMHWMGNTVANTLLAGLGGQAFVTLSPGQEWLSSFGVEGALMMVIFGAVGYLLYRQRKNGIGD